MGDDPEQVGAWIAGGQPLVGPSSMTLRRLSGWDLATARPAEARQWEREVECAVTHDPSSARSSSFLPGVSEHDAGTVRGLLGPRSCPDSQRTRAGTSVDNPSVGDSPARWVVRNGALDLPLPLAGLSRACPVARSHPDNRAGSSTKADQRLPAQSRRRLFRSSPSPNLCESRMGAADPLTQGLTMAELAERVPGQLIGVVDALVANPRRTGDDPASYSAAALRRYAVALHPSRPRERECRGRSPGGGHTSDGRGPLSRQDSAPTVHLGRLGERDDGVDEALSIPRRHVQPKKWFSLRPAKDDGG